MRGVSTKGPLTLSLDSLFQIAFTERLASRTVVSQKIPHCLLMITVQFVCYRTIAHTETDMVFYDWL